MLPAQFNSSVYEAGCDEAGRGCLAGPVFAAAVVLPPNYRHPDLRDSKTLSASRRAEMTELIWSNAIDFNVALVEPADIDSINILQASILAMHKALDGLLTVPQSIIVDGNKFNTYRNIEHQCVIKGDNKFGNIAAASILAKQYRDVYMKHLHLEYPFYGWERNKGYPTKEHRSAIVKYGITIHHRKSFRLIAGE
jgi:ribonuclease HII